MVLVDTSVWIGHFHKTDAILARLLEEERVILHPFVLGELACGTLQNRTEIISLLHALPVAPRVEDDEVLFFIARHKLMGQGMGLIDIHLLASCCLASCKLWTRDKRLLVAAQAMKVDWKDQKVSEH